MTLPKKGRRSIIVDGTEYHWLAAFERSERIVTSGDGFVQRRVRGGAEGRRVADGNAWPTNVCVQRENTMAQASDVREGTSPFEEGHVYYTHLRVKLDGDTRADLVESWVYVGEAPRCEGCPVVWRFARPKRDGSTWGASSEIIRVASVDDGHEMMLDASELQELVGSRVVVGMLHRSQSTKNDEPE